MEKVLKNKGKSLKLTTLGFTLIELLATIIILAIVSLIATPILLNVLEEVRISAGMSESNMILSGINNYCSNEDLMYELDNSYKIICDTNMDENTVKQMVNLGKADIKEIEYDGEKLTTLIIESNNHTFTLCPIGTFAVDDEKCERDPNSLITKLLNKYNESDTTGLIKDSVNENLYYYKGNNQQVSNNFLWYGGHQWRVLEFDVSANTLTLITQQPLMTMMLNGSVWTTKEAYESSYINNWLNDYFYNSLDSSIQKNIKDSIFNVGIYTNVDEITTKQKIGMLDEEQYKRAGGTNSFLDIKDGFWLPNRYNSSNFRRVNSSGGFSNEIPSNRGIRLVMKISDIKITDGEGTLTSNYKTSTKATNTNNIQVGEYISLPYNGNDNACGSDKKCLFRVVSKDNDSIKVTLNGLLPTTSAYGSSGIISTSSTIYNILDSFANNLTSNYLYSNDKFFYNGDYGDSLSYTNIKNREFNSIIGLPTIGEIFSGNDIDLSTSSSKTFVDVNTIENPTVTYYYFTLNRHNESTLRCISGYGHLYSGSYSEKLGVRPVVYLKNNLKIFSGDGTAQNPYILQ